MNFLVDERSQIDKVPDLIQSIGHASGNSHSKKRPRGIFDLKFMYICLYTKCHSIHI